MDERLLSGVPAPDERDRDATLRPRVLGEFIGQSKLKETLGLSPTFGGSGRRRAVGLSAG